MFDIVLHRSQYDITFHDKELTSLRYDTFVFFHVVVSGEFPTTSPTLVRLLPGMLSHVPLKHPLRGQDLSAHGTNEGVHSGRKFYSCNDKWLKL